MTIRKPLLLCVAAWILYAMAMVGATLGTRASDSVPAEFPHPERRGAISGIETGGGARPNAATAIAVSEDARAGGSGGKAPLGMVEEAPGTARIATPSIVSLTHPLNSITAGTGIAGDEAPQDAAAPSQIAPGETARRVRIGDRNGQTIIARAHGPADSGLVLLPDGRLGWPNRMIYTDEPFVPVSPEALIEELQEGPFAGFKSLRTQHYVILYSSSDRFAEQSSRLLESLYAGLMARFKGYGFDVHEAEFPLVAVIFEREEDFRAHREIDADIQAYYDIVSNRIFFFELREREEDDPQVAAMRKPQTVAHEGTHQILHNIGVQPRLSDWPPWIVEGLAELAAAPRTRNGEWAGFSQPYPTHIATLEDLQDSLNLQSRSARSARVKVGRAPGGSRVEYIITREHLTPTDYALSWALTHFLANKRTDEFLDYIKELSQSVPGKKRDARVELDRFHRHFGAATAALEPEISRHLSKLRNQTQLVYYAVLFEQPLPGNLIRRGTLVSRSPQLIREWIEERMPDPRGGVYTWRVVPFRNRQQAFLFTEQWVNSG